MKKSLTFFLAGLLITACTSIPKYAEERADPDVMPVVYLHSFNGDSMSVINGDTVNLTIRNLVKHEDLVNPITK